jgi:hypothetical protein
MSTYEKCINGMTYRWDSEMWVSAYDMGGHQLKCLELPAPPATKFETATNVGQQISTDISWAIPTEYQQRDFYGTRLTMITVFLAAILLIHVIRFLAWLGEDAPKVVPKLKGKNGKAVPRG